MEFERTRGGFEIEPGQGGITGGGEIDGHVGTDRLRKRDGQYHVPRFFSNHHIFDCNLCLIIIEDRDFRLIIGKNDIGARGLDVAEFDQKTLIEFYIIPVSDVDGNGLGLFSRCKSQPARFVGVIVKRCCGVCNSQVIHFDFGCDRLVE